MKLSIAACMIFTLNLYFLVCSENISGDDRPIDVTDGEEGMVEVLLSDPGNCDLWIWSDSFISIEQTLKYISGRGQPLYFISLATDILTQNYTSRRTGRFDQTNCIQIVIFCNSFEKCNNAPGLFKPLQELATTGSPIRRKMILVLNTEIASTRKVSPKDVELIQNVGITFSRAKAHITMVRKFIESSGKSGSSELTYHLLAWTPNWLPGGSPFLFDTWTKSKGFQFRNKLTIDVNKINPRSNLRICLPSFHMSPLFKGAGSGENRSCCTGMHAQLLKDLASKLKLNLIFMKAKERDYGQRSKCGSGYWTGAVGCIVRKEADIGMGHLIFNPQRLRADVTLGPWDSILNGAVVCSEAAPLPSGNLLFLPFQVDVWVYVILTSLLTFISFKVLENITRKFLRPILIRSSNWYERPKVKKESVNWVHVMAPLCADSIPTESIPRRSHFLVLVAFWFLFSYLVTTFFATGLVGLLLSDPKETNVESLRDMLQRGDDPWFLTHLVQETIVHSEFEVDQTLVKYQQKNQFQRKSTMDFDLEAYLYVRRTVDTCLLDEEVRSKYYLPYILTQDTEIPDLYVASRLFYLGPAGLIFRSDMDFTLQIFISKFMRNYDTTGLSTWNLQAFQKRIPDYKLYHDLIAKNQKILPLNFANVKIVFIASIISLTFATFVFIAELSWFHWTDQFT